MASREHSKLTESPTVNVIVVDDSAVFRLVIRDALNSIPDCSVVGHARDGRVALEVIEKSPPDLVTLDIEMPELDGIQTLREIKRRWPDTGVIMVSRLTTASADITTDALLEGAFDFVLKPSGPDPAQNKAALKVALEQKVNAYRESRSLPHQAGTVSAADESSNHANGAAVDAVVIGTSTGGPETLSQVVGGLARDLAVPVVIVQHMPTGYTSRLAARLNDLSPLQIREAADQDVLRAGDVLVAPGGRQLQLYRNGPGRVMVRLTDDPPEHGCQPSVDYVLRSAADVFDGAVLAVILTGMGSDGTEGCRLVRSRGGQVIAQHADDCIVFGMPRSVIRNNLADRVVRLKHTAAVINQTVGARARK